MIFYFNIFVLQEFQMLALSLLTAVAVIVKSFCEKKGLCIFTGGVLKKNIKDYKNYN